MKFPISDALARLLMRAGIGAFGGALGSVMALCEGLPAHFVRCIFGGALLFVGLGLYQEVLDQISINRAKEKDDADTDEATRRVDHDW